MYDVIILGAGPAGLTAGIYAARGGLNAVIVESSAVGGQASLTAEIENYPGFESVNGFELVSIMQAQCDRLGVTFVFDNPVNVSLEGEVKRVTTAASGTLEARTVIIATGALPRTLGLPNESALMGGGVSYCATCDGAFFRGKPVAVVGGGNTAVEDALYLLKFASDVWLIHRRDALRADAILADRVKSSGSTASSSPWDRLPPRQGLRAWSWTAATSSPTRRCAPPSPECLPQATSGKNPCAKSSPPPRMARSRRKAR